MVYAHNLRQGRDRGQTFLSELSSTTTNELKGQTLATHISHLEQVPVAAEISLPEQTSVTQLSDKPGESFGSQYPRYTPLPPFHVPSAP